jgi:hypothetical protein
MNRATNTAPSRDELFLVHTDLECARNMLATLAECACLAAEAKTISDTFSAGLSDLFSYALSQLDTASDVLFQLSADTAPVPPKSANGHINMRDRFILQSFAEGASPTDISQALHLRQSAVLRIINRLSGRAEGDEAATG